MKTQMFLKGAMVAIVLFVGAALFAGTSGVKCEGSVVDQYGEGIVGITVTTTSVRRFRQRPIAWAVFQCRESRRDRLSG